LNVNKKIGEKIRQIRVLRGLSQENVAEEIGMSHGNFGKIERGEIEVNSSKLIEIARVLKVSPADFFEDRTRPLVKEVRQEYGFATREELQTLSKLVQGLVIEFEKLRDEQAKAPRKKANPGAGRKKKRS
jgi:transcriptional regulator with XRE-family HTH domain